MSHSACKRQMINDRAQFHTFTFCVTTERVGGNHSIKSLGYGSVNLLSALNGVRHCPILIDGIFAPETIFNLTGVLQLMERNFQVTFKRDEAHSRQDLAKLFNESFNHAKMNGIEMRHSLYRAGIQVKKERITLTTKSLKRKSNVWYQLLRRLSNESII